MCYEFGSWFGKVRETELRKAREKVDPAKRASAAAPPKEPECEREEVREPEKMPA